MLIKKYLHPFFGHMAPEAIKTGVINDWIADLKSKGLKSKTVHNMWKLFRALMNWNAQQNDEPKRVWHPTLPATPEDEQRWFTQDEVCRIVEAAPRQFKVLFHLAAFSGLRSGELAGLHVEDLDFARGVIRVRRSVWNGIEVSTKTKRGYRDVWIDSLTVQILREYLSSRNSVRRTGGYVQTHKPERWVPVSSLQCLRSYQIHSPVCFHRSMIPSANRISDGGILCPQSNVCPLGAIS